MKCKKVIKCVIPEITNILSLPYFTGIEKRSVYTSPVSSSIFLSNPFAETASSIIF